MLSVLLPNHHLTPLPRRVLLEHLSVDLHELVKQLEVSQSHYMAARWAHQLGSLVTADLQRHHSLWMSPVHQELSRHPV